MNTFLVSAIINLIFLVLELILMQKQINIIKG